MWQPLELLQTDGGSLPEQVEVQSFHCVIRTVGYSLHEVTSLPHQHGPSTLLCAMKSSQATKCHNIEGQILLLISCSYITTGKK